jgi:tRNA threonylcarbamoyladenosine biosynthesis protein TsaB
MRILAIDTASARCSAALWLDGRCVQRDAPTARDHAKLLLPFVDQVLAEAQLGLSGVDVIAFGRGPGSFTGVRVACSVAQGLALGADLPVLPVSDLRALAAQALRLLAGTPAPMPGRVITCMDARMSEVYWAAFPIRAGLPDDRGVVEAVGPPDTVTRLDDGVADVPGAAGIAGIGAGFSAWPQLASRLGIPDGHCLPGLEPSAIDIAHLAAADLAAGRVAGPPEQAQPVYLRDNVACVPKSASIR